MNKTSSSIDTANDSALNTYEDAKDKWTELEHSIRATGWRASQAGRNYVQDNPFRCVAIAGVTGLTLGLLLSVFRN